MTNSRTKTQNIAYTNLDTVLGNKNAIFSFFKTVQVFKNWPTYFWDILFPSPGKTVTLHTQSASFLCRSGTMNKFIVKEVWGESHFLPSSFDISPGDTVIDIGAQLGDFTVLATQKANSGRVIAIEPEVTNFELLKKNIKLNRLTNVIPLGVAISNRNDFRTMSIDSGNSGGHFLSSQKNNSSDSMRVTTLTIASLFSKHKIKLVDYLKVDCEGSEYDIFFSLPPKYFPRILKISMETHNLDKKRNTDTMAELLANKGYFVDVISNRGVPTSIILARL